MHFPPLVDQLIRASKRLAPTTACLLLLVLKPSVSHVERDGLTDVPPPPWSRGASGAMTFEPNRGQFADPARFVGHGPEANVFLSPTRVEFALAGPERSARVNLRLLEARAGARMRGAGELSGVMHYLRGSDPAGWITDVPSYDRVEVEGVYPDIDLVFRDEGGRLAYDFVVAPGADPDRIRLVFDGAEQVRLDGAGDLILTTAAGEMRQRRPFLYQEEAGGRQEVAGGYALAESGEVTFLVADHDASRPLVIDPSLIYSTRTGGNCRAYTGVLDVTADADGNAYVVGYYPWDCDRGSENVYVTKYAPDGRRLFGTAFGGWFNDTPYGIAVDAAGNIYVTGSTTAAFPGPPPFPIVNPIQAVHAGVAGDTDAFVTVFDPTGRAILFSTFLGGTGADSGRDIEVNDSGTIFVTGVTSSTDFPMVGAEQPIPGGGGDAFVAAIDPIAPTLLFSTYLGGSGSDTAWRLSVTRSGVLVTGTTSSADFPLGAVAGQVQPAYGGGASDAFVARYASTGRLQNATYLGGSGRDEGYGIATDHDGASYVTGATESSDFPTANALQPALSRPPDADAFLTKLSPAGTELVYSTYLEVGRSAICYPHLSRSASFSFGCGAVAVNGQGSAFVTTPGVFVTKVDAAGSLRPYTSHGFGGYGIALTPLGEILVAGRVHVRDNFPTVNAAEIGPHRTGPIEETGWLVKLSDEPNPDAAFEQDDLRITYTGGWALETGSEFSGCSAMRSSEPGAAAVISYTGTGIQIIGRRDPAGSEAYTYDDQDYLPPLKRPSSYGSPAEPRAVLYSVSNLFNGPHTQTIEVAGYYQGPSTGAVWIDGINVLGDPNSVVASHTPCNHAPRAAAAAPEATECSSPAGAALTLDGSNSFDEDSSPGTSDDIAHFEWIEDARMPSERPLGTGESLRVVLPLGPHRISLRVTDASGAFGTDEISVNVVDTIPPAVSVQPNPRLLWPPNHRMVPVALSAEASDLCDPAPMIALVSVTSSEPDDAPGIGDGRTLHDIQGVTVGAASTQIRLCAERAESGGGRVYTVSYLATDGSGNAGSRQTSVVVPHTFSGNR